MKIVVVIAFISGIAGCMKQSEKYCAMHPDDTEHCSGGDDGGMACVDNDDCIAIDPTKAVCTDDRMCVECTVEDATACTDGRVCLGRACGDCTDHAQCDSGVCQASGRCADASMVAYVAPTGGGDQCTQAAPCDDANEAENTARPIIKVTGIITSTNQVMFSARSTAIYAEPGAAFTRSSPGNIIEISNDGTELAIYGLRIFGASSATNSGNGIFFMNQGDPKLTIDRCLIESNTGSGVRAPDGGDITITRSVIANNSGSTGLVLQNGKFNVTNTVIAGNGRNTLTSAGGALLQPALASKFEFNTLADNMNNLGAGNYRGITCVSFDLANDIVVGNDTSGCGATYTFFSSGDMVVGTGNKMGNPVFVSTAMPSSATYYRIDPTSPAKDEADTAATLTMDIDGNMRPIDGRSDMGADEVAP